MVKRQPDGQNDDGEPRETKLRLAGHLTWIARRRAAARQALCRHCARWIAFLCAHPNGHADDGEQRETGPDNGGDVHQQHRRRNTMAYNNDGEQQNKDDDAGLPGR